MTTNTNVNRLQFGTWNFKTLYLAGRLEHATRILKSFGLSFMGLSEVRWNENDQMMTTKEVHFYSRECPSNTTYPSLHCRHTHSDAKEDVEHVKSDTSMLMGEFDA